VHYKIILSGEKINQFINYCEDKDDPYFLEFEQILKNALRTLEPITEPLKKTNGDND